MQRGRVLLIEAETKVADRLAEALRGKGYEIVVCGEARAGFETACGMSPDCIVCNIELPDIDGFWVARRIRTEQGPVSSTPFLFLADTDDEDARLQGLHVGADVYISMPFTHEEVEAQIAALIDMARRLRARRDSFIGEPQSSKQGVALRGELAHMPLASILSILEMERRSGQLKVSSDSGQSAVFTLMGGTFVHSEMNGTEGKALDILRDVLRWRAGKFYFTPRDTPQKAAPRLSIGEVLLTAMQLEDESRR
ncbi:MAG: response regulator [Polyangiaceae bacterium]